MKKQLILLSILCLPFSYNYSQTQKTMTTDDIFDGKLTYQYYEDTKTSEYVKHGSYKYSRRKQMSGGTYNFTITGQYIHGKKDGIWNIIETLVDYPNNAGSYTTGSENLLQSFKDGIANGEWKYSKDFKTRSKLYNRGKYLWSIYTLDDNSLFASASFIDGFATGTVVYKDMFLKSKRTISLNRNGFMTGCYTLTDNSFQNSSEELVFNEDGVITKNVSRDGAGKVISKNGLDDELISVAVQYTKGQITDQQLNSNHIKLDTLSISNIFDYSELFDYKKSFRFDASNTNNPDLNDSTVEIYSYGHYIYPKRIELIDLNENPTYYNARMNFDTDGFRKLLEEHSFEMSDSDIEKVKKEMAEIENIKLFSNKFNENYEKIIDKVSIYKKPENRTEISELTLNSISAELDKIDSEQTEIRNKINKEKSKIDVALKAATNLRVNDFFTFNYKNSYDVSIEALSATENIFLPLVNNITSIVTKAEKADKLLSELKAIYGIVNTTNSYFNELAASRLTKDQKTLLTVYDEIISNNKQKLQISKDSNTTNLILDNIILVNEKVVKLKDTDLKELLKSIKKSKSIEEKISLIEN